jgi:hypothetical protein
MSPKEYLHEVVLVDDASNTTGGKEEGKRTKRAG